MLHSRAPANPKQDVDPEDALMMLVPLQVVSRRKQRTTLPMRIPTPTCHSVSSPQVRPPQQSRALLEHRNHLLEPITPMPPCQKVFSFANFSFSDLYIYLDYFT